MPKYEFVAVDFDGTLCADAFPEVGAPNRAVIDYVKRLAADGSKIILYTSRENGTRKLLDEAVAFCKAQEIPLYAVNENPGNPHAAKIGLKPSDGRKVYADLYIDDKAIKPGGGRKNGGIYKAGGIRAAAGSRRRGRPLARDYKAGGAMRVHHLRRGGDGYSCDEYGSGQHNGGDKIRRHSAHERTLPARNRPARLP